MSRPDLELAMRTLAATTGNPAPLPDADLVWQRAAARARWRQSDLATCSIRVAERAACIVSAATGAAALVALRPGIVAALGALDPTLVRLLGLALLAATGAALVLCKELAAEK